MANLYYKASDTTPEISLDNDQGVLAIRGESYPENALEFYQPVVEAVVDLLTTSSTPFLIQVDLAYLNTSSVKALMDILDLAEDAHKAGRQVEVEWVYDQENDRSLEMAEEFQEDLTLPFHVTPVTR